MKRVCFCFFASFVLLFFLCCKGEEDRSEFEVEYEQKIEMYQKKDTGSTHKISYPVFKAYPELNKIIASKIEAEKLYIDNEHELVEYDISFGDIRTSGRYIGFMFDTSSYFNGAAHPIKTLSSLNYDTKEKKEVGIEDIFLPLSKDYLKILSEFTYKELTSRVEKGEFDSKDEFISEGTDMKEENFCCFNLKGKEVIVVFNQYQVAPYSSGISEVNVPIEIFK